MLNLATREKLDTQTLPPMCQQSENRDLSRQNQAIQDLLIVIDMLTIIECRVSRCWEFQISILHRINLRRYNCSYVLQNQFENYDASAETVLF